MVTPVAEDHHAPSSERFTHPCIRLTSSPTAGNSKSAARRRRSRSPHLMTYGNSDRRAHLSQARRSVHRQGLLNGFRLKLRHRPDRPRFAKRPRSSIAVRAHRSTRDARVLPIPESTPFGVPPQHPAWQYSRFPRVRTTAAA